MKTTLIICLIVFAAFLIFYQGVMTELTLLGAGIAQDYQIPHIEVKSPEIVEIEEFSGVYRRIHPKFQPAMYYIKEQSEKWDIPIETFLGIANAESSLYRFDGYNPWGITINGEVINFKNWEQSVEYFAKLIRTRYFNQGMDTPEKMLLTYVAWDNPYWVRNVKEYWN